jgi:hypothetical protein
MEILDPALKERLWHKMRADLACYNPGTANDNLLMCCLCCRFLPFEAFSLEHIIPQQALDDDPPEVKSRSTVNERSGNILLCKKLLKLKGSNISLNGCNGWKGRYYDGKLRELFNRRVIDNKYARPSTTHTISAVVVAYLAMFMQFGYQISLTQSGILIRHQFFSPAKFVKQYPDMGQILFMGSAPPFHENYLSYWKEPFSFNVQPSGCTVSIRNVNVTLPISRDPNLAVARHMQVVPQRFILRPNFHTAFD